MKQIIDNKLYDTEKAEMILKLSFGLKILYKTNKDNYFIFYMLTNDIEPICIEQVKKELKVNDIAKYAKYFPQDFKNDDELKEKLKILNADTYIKLFGEVEEA